MKWVRARIVGPIDDGWPVPWSAQRVRGPQRGIFKKRDRPGKGGGTKDRTEADTNVPGHAGVGRWRIASTGVRQVKEQGQAGTWKVGCIPPSVE